jgi:uncharacterized repeat protein (TIGR01451 family)
MKIKSLFIFFTIITVTLLTSFVLEANINEVEAATLSLSCSSSTSSSVTLRYSYSSATSPTIYRDGSKVAGLPSGSNSGTYTNRGLSAGTSYTYTLRSGNTTKTATCKTSGGTTTVPKTSTPTTTSPAPKTTYPTYSYTPVYAAPAPVTDWKPWYPEYNPTYAPSAPVTDWKPWYPEYTPTYSTQTPVQSIPAGSIRCSAETENSITLSYDLENGNNAAVFRGDERIHAIGSGTRSGSFVESGLAPGTTYEFYLRNGLFAYSDQLSRVSCKTKDQSVVDSEKEFYIQKSVRSLEREGTWVNSITVSPGEVVSFSIKVTAGDTNLNSVEVKDILPRNIEYLGNIKVDGASALGNITEGVNIGGISRLQSKTVTFDAKIYSRENFDIGTTILTNTARVSSLGVTLTDTAVLNVIKGEVAGPPTVVPTGITGNTTFDYLLLPLLLTALLFILFRKHFLVLVKRLEVARNELKAEWI